MNVNDLKTKSLPVCVSVFSYKVANLFTTDIAVTCDFTDGSHIKGLLIKDRQSNTFIGMTTLQVKELLK